MKAEMLSAWLLHQRPVKHATSQVFFMTRERGLVQAFCAGYASTKKRAILQPFTLLCLTLNEKHYGTYVKQLEVADSPYYLAGNHLLAGLYLNELLYRTFKPEMRDAHIFEVYQNALAGLAQGHTRSLIEITLRRFEKALINSLGYGVSYRYEAHSNTPIAANSRYIFLPDEGFILNSQGFLGSNILAIDEDKFDHVDVLKTAKLIMRSTIDHILEGTKIQTRLLYSTS